MILNNSEHQKPTLGRGIPIISIIGLLILLSSCTTAREEKETSLAARTGTVPASSAFTGPLTSKLHQTYTLDDNIQYAIDSVENSKCLGQMSKGKTAGEGALFYIVRFHARNTGKVLASVKTAKLQVETADGQTYSPSDKGIDAVMINGGTKDLFENDLEPAGSRAFLAIFELPVQAVKDGASLIVPSSKSGSVDRWVLPLDDSKGKHQKK